MGKNDEPSSRLLAPTLSSKSKQKEKVECPLWKRLVFDVGLRTYMKEHKKELLKSREEVQQPISNENEESESGLKKLNIVFKTMKWIAKGKANARKKKFQRIREELLRSLREFDETGRKIVSNLEPGDDVPIQNQVNLKMYSDEALLKRERLTTDPEVLHYIDQWWENMYKFSSTNGMDEDTYTKMYEIIYDVLVPGQDEAVRKKSAKSDWDNDADGSDLLNHDQFRKSIFQLSDVWCETCEKDEYVGFINAMHQNIARMSNEFEWDIMFKRPIVEYESKEYEICPKVVKKALDNWNSGTWHDEESDKSDGKSELNIDARKTKQKSEVKRMTKPPPIDYSNYKGVRERMEEKWKKQTVLPLTTSKSPFKRSRRRERKEERKRKKIETLPPPQLATIELFQQKSKKEIGDTSTIKIRLELELEKLKNREFLKLKAMKNADKRTLHAELKVIRTRKREIEKEIGSLRKRLTFQKRRAGMAMSGSVIVPWMISTEVDQDDFGQENKMNGKNDEQKYLQMISVNDLSQKKPTESLTNQQQMIKRLSNYGIKSRTRKSEHMAQKNDVRSTGFQRNDKNQTNFDRTDFETHDSSVSTGTKDKIQDERTQFLQTDEKRSLVRTGRESTENEKVEQDNKSRIIDDEKDKEETMNDKIIYDNRPNSKTSRIKIYRPNDTFVRDTTVDFVKVEDDGLICFQGTRLETLSSSLKRNNRLPKIKKQNQQFTVQQSTLQQSTERAMNSTAFNNANFNDQNNQHRFNVEYTKKTQKKVLPSELASQSNNPCTLNGFTKVYGNIALLAARKTEQGLYVLKPTGEGEWFYKSETKVQGTRKPKRLPYSFEELNGLHVRGRDYRVSNFGNYKL